MTAVSGAHALVLVVGPGAAHEDRVIGMSLDVLLEILRTLEGLATEVTFVRLQRDMDTDVRCDVVTLDSGGTAGCPLARQVEIVSALAANMFVTDVLVENFRRSEAFTARIPPADKGVVGSCSGGRSGSRCIASVRGSCCGSGRCWRIALGI